MGECLRELGVTRELIAKDQLSELRHRGYTVFLNVIDGLWLSELRQRFDALISAEGDRAGVEVSQEAGAPRLANLVNKGVVFDQVWSNAVLLAAVYAVIDAPFHLSSLNGRDASPGAGLQALHQDGRRTNTAKTYGCNSLWMLDDFSVENGCTRFVPGTQHSPRPDEVIDDPKSVHPDEELVIAPAGSMVVFHSHLWHGGTMNKSRDRKRRALHCYFTTRDTLQQTDQRKYLRRTTWTRLTSASRYLLNLPEQL